MGLFSKKYDSIDDRLILKFDLDKKRFYYLLKDRILSDNELNKRTRKSLFSINEELKNPEYLKNVLYQEETKRVLAEDNERTKFLSSKGYTFESFSTLKGIVPQGTMSDTVEKVLLPLVNNDQNLVGIHRVQAGVSNAQIEDILLNGLILNGHLGGATSNKSSLSDHVSYYSNNRIIINELMFADAYKNSSGSILVNIPFSDLDKDVIIKNKDTIRLNPKYIVGYIPLHENHHLESIVTSDEIKNTMMKRINVEEPYILGETINKYKDNFEINKHR